VPLRFSLALVLALAGCDGSTDGPLRPDSGMMSLPDSGGDVSETTYHGDLRPILAANCMTCHEEGGVAPFALETYEQAVEVAERMEEVTRDRIMPPFLADTSGECNTWSNHRGLTDDEIAVFEQWVLDGKLEGDPTTPDPERAVLPELPSVDLTLEMPTYAIDASEDDDYRCFVVETGLTENQYVTGYDVHPGNVQRVHHVIVYNPIDADAVAAAEALDAEHGAVGDGYPCFGGPLVQAPPMVLWAPGAGATRFPRNTGVQVLAGIKQIATDAAKMITDMAAKAGGGYRFEYSPESFTGTELEVALEICNAVIEIMQPTPDNKLIINLPSTVEMSTPNIYADQIEWMCRNLDNRENLIISLHPHNDRGTGIAATELGLMAGADRVEGTLFGNGERTGNVDVVTLALNMYTQGVDPMLDCRDINRMKDVYEYCNQLVIPERHPYVGELVYTAFSGSHQDAINKGMKAIKAANKPLWEVPYLPIDPQDVGRSYEAIIRINSQSGKGGIAYVLQADYGLNLPRNLQVEFREDIQDITDREGKELPAARIHERFQELYVEQPGARLKFVDHQTFPDASAKGRRVVEATIMDGGEEKAITGTGTGPVDGFIDALSKHIGVEMSVLNYSEHSLQQGSNAAAVCYMEVEHPGGKLFGVGINHNIVTASLEAVVSAANRILS